MKKRVVVALGHRALGLPEQQTAVRSSASILADLSKKAHS